MLQQWKTLHEKSKNIDRPAMSLFHLWSIQVHSGGKQRNKINRTFYTGKLAVNTFNCFGKEICHRHLFLQERLVICRPWTASHKWGYAYHRFVSLGFNHDRPWHEVRQWEEKWCHKRGDFDPESKCNWAFRWYNDDIFPSISQHTSLLEVHFLVESWILEVLSIRLKFEAVAWWP